MRFFSTKSFGADHMRMLRSVPDRVRQCRPLRVGCRAADSRRVQELREALGGLETEALSVRERAREAQKRRNSLLEAVRGMEKLAAQCLERYDQERARSIIQEKVQVQQELDEADETVRNLVTLEAKLHEAIEKKSVELSRTALEEGQEFRDDAAGVSIVLGPDGKPMFQRTRLVGQAQEGSATRGAGEDSADFSQQRGGSFSGRPGFSGLEDSSRIRDDDISNVEELLTRSEMQLNDQFVELERRLLERSLKASPGPDAEPLRTAPISPWDRPPSVRHKELAVPTGSGVSEAEVSEKQMSRMQEARTAARPEWWTMGQNALMEGALANLAETYEPLYADGAVALVAAVNPLHNSIVPNANQLLSLVALSLRSPKSQGSSQHWGAEHAKGSEDLTNNTRLAIYGAALQLVAEDLIGKKHKILPKEHDRRAREARAFLVALAAAIRLRGDDASDYSVRFVCRVIRTSLLDAHKPLRKAYEAEDKSSLERAEGTLRALHRVLRALPSTLALANDHSACVEVTAALKRVLSQTDARRLDKLYRIVSSEDISCTAMRAVLGPIFDA